jgi:hypothetical protein
MSRFLLASLLVGFLAVLGCGRSDTATGPNGEKIKVDQKIGAVEVTGVGKDGTARVSTDGKGIALPSNFPKDIPIYSGAKVMSSVEANGEQMLTLQTSDSVEKVDEYYAKSLKDENWTIEATMKLPQANTYSTKKENRKLSVNIAQGDTTTIIIAIKQEK